jgi:hypothetical protein
MKRVYDVSDTGPKPGTSKTGFEQMKIMKEFWLSGMEVNKIKPKSALSSVGFCRLHPL